MSFDVGTGTSNLSRAGTICLGMALTVSDDSPGVTTRRKGDQSPHEHLTVFLKRTHAVKNVMLGLTKNVNMQYK